MSEDQQRITRAYKRAGVGLAIGTLLWIVVILFRSGESEKADWLIPVCAAALSVIFFALHSKSKEQ
jgi:hypothetical protein